VYCWGSNVYGQVGNGNLNPAPNPTRVATPIVASAATTYLAHACVLAAGGAAYCWGYNGQGQLGIADTGYTCSPVLSCAFPNPFPVKGGLSFGSISAGGGYTCGVTVGQAAYCWGSNLNGEGGSPTSADTCIPIVPCNPAPTLVAGGLTFVSVNAGGSITCGVTTTHDGYCWGVNAEAQLGNGNMTKQSRPTAVIGGIKFREIVPGIRHTCGIATDGHAYCWGNNIIGGLGIGRFEGLFTSPQAVVAP
jgi:alpha-tubulin suppressor-like RCC1 family protein